MSYFQLAKDLLHPSPDEERRKHKLKRLVQSPNSYFMDVKCPGESDIISLCFTTSQWSPIHCLMARIGGVSLYSISSHPTGGKIPQHNSLGVYTPHGNKYPWVTSLSLLLLLPTPVQVAIRSPQCSVMLRRSCCVSVVQLYCVSLQVEEQGSLKVRGHPLLGG